MARGWWRDPGRAVKARSRVIVRVTPTGLHRLALLAVVHGVSRGGLCRAAVEAWVCAEAHERRAAPPDAGPRPPPEVAGQSLSIWLMPETAEAVKTLAAESGASQAAVIRQALDAVAAECGAAPVFARRRTPGFASRHAVGLAQPRWWRRKFEES